MHAAAPVLMNADLARKYAFPDCSHVSCVWELDNIISKVGNTKDIMNRACWDCFGIP